MPADFPFNLGSFPYFLLALAASVAVVGFGHVRRVVAPALTKWLIALAMPLIALAAGDLTWEKPAPRKLVVMVDLSPSTRGAKYREPEYLQMRLSELLGESAYEIVTFAEANMPPSPGVKGMSFADLPSERTVFAPPAGT